MSRSTIDLGGVRSVADATAAEWRVDFEAALRRPLAERFDYSFVNTPKPVIDDAPYRVFETMEQYRAWCRVALPSWLGYG